MEKLICRHFLGISGACCAARALPGATTNQAPPAAMHYNGLQCPPEPTWQPHRCPLAAFAVDREPLVGASQIPRPSAASTQQTWLDAPSETNLHCFHSRTPSTRRSKTHSYGVAFVSTRVRYCQPDTAQAVVKQADPLFETDHPLH